MDPESWLELGVIFLSLILAAFAATAESSVRLITRAKVRYLIERGVVSKGQAVDEFLVHLNDYSATIAILNTLAILVGAGVTTLLAITALPALGVPMWLAAVVLAVLLIFSQVLPKAAVACDPERFAAGVAGPLNAFTSLLSWLTAFFRVATALVMRGLKLGPGHGKMQVLEEELRMLGVGGEEGILDEEEKEMIHGIVTMEDLSAREIMTPRIDIAAVDDRSTVGALADVFVEQGYSRVPVYHETIDDIVGVAYAKDLFTTLKAGKLETPVTALMRPAYFVPESKRTDELLHEMQVREIHMAIVVDEYGGIAGLVTIEDLLEEIVGEIRDEYDRGEGVKIEEIADGEAVFEGTVTVDDVNETLGIRLNVEDVDTIGGLVYDKLGKIPSPGDVVDLDDALITVLETDGRRIRRVKVVRQSRIGHGPAANEREASPQEQRG